MVKVNIKNNRHNISIEGHSDSNIVCSAISSIMITTVNAIWSFSKDYLKYDRVGDSSYIEILEDHKITKVLIDNMINMLRDLEGDYSENIEIKEE